MRHRTITLGVLLAVVLLSTPANAGWRWKNFWSDVEVGFYRNNVWPEPFASADRALTRAPMEIQKNNGWRMQNTISDQLFDEESDALNEAGRLRVFWIVTQSPIHRRTVFVLRGKTPDVTSIRVDSVQKAVAKSLPEGGMPDVVVTSVIPHFGSGVYYDNINRPYQQSVPSPRLNSGEEGN